MNSHQRRTLRRRSIRWMHKLPGIARECAKSMERLAVELQKFSATIRNISHGQKTVQES